MALEQAVQTLTKQYPDIDWDTIEPSSETLETYGDGTILRGQYDGKSKEFFILSEDQRKVKWGTVIAHHLYEMVEEDDDDTRI